MHQHNELTPPLQVLQPQESIASDLEVQTSPVKENGTAKNAKEYDGTVPLEDRDREDFAVWLATPRNLRQDRTQKAYITRRGWISANGTLDYPKLWRWHREKKVIARVNFLTAQNSAIARNVVRRELVAMAESMTKRAKVGDVGAFRAALEFIGEMPTKPSAAEVELRQMSLHEAIERSGRVILPSWATDEGKDVYEDELEPGSERGNHGDSSPSL